MGAERVTKSTGDTETRSQERDQEAPEPTALPLHALNLSRQNILYLQRTIGNKRVQHLVSNKVLQRDYRENIGEEFRVNTSATIEYDGRVIPFNLNAQEQTLQLPANTRGVLRIHARSRVQSADILGRQRTPISRVSAGDFRWEVNIDADGNFHRGNILRQDTPTGGNTGTNLLLWATVTLSALQDPGDNQVGFHIHGNRTDNSSAAGFHGVNHSDAIDHDFRITIEADPKTLRQNKNVVPPPPASIRVPSALLHRSVFFNREGRTTLSDGTGSRIGQYNDERAALEHYVEELRVYSDLWDALTTGREPIRVSVQGFASPPGSSNRNEQISEQRANRVAELLRHRFSTNPGTVITVANEPWHGNEEQQRQYQSLSDDDRERVNQQLRVVNIEISETDARIAIENLRHRREQAAQLGGGQPPAN